MDINYSDTIIGIWKFDEKITQEVLQANAEKWAAEDPKYVHLYVRQVSKDQYGIGFEYQAYDGIDPSEHEKAYDEYFGKMTDRLKRDFGNDLRGWDISSRAIVIK